MTEVPGGFACPVLVRLGSRGHLKLLAPAQSTAHDSERASSHLHVTLPAGLVREDS